jgi:hypothetical protein
LCAVFAITVIITTQIKQSLQLNMHACFHTHAHTGTQTGTLNSKLCFNPHTAKWDHTHKVKNNKKKAIPTPACINTLVAHAGKRRIIYKLCIF